MSDEARPADAASAGRFDNPIAEADGGGEEEAAAGSEPAPSAAEAPFFCKVVRVQLRLLGGNSLFRACALVRRGGGPGFCTGQFSIIGFSLIKI